MNIVAVVLRLYSYLYHGLLCFVMLGVCAIASGSNNYDLKIGWLPATGIQGYHILLYSAIIGVITLLLAVTGLFRWAFPVWCLLVFIQMVRWLLLPGYTFPSPEEFKWTVWLIVGALGAFLSSLQLLKSKERLRRERGQA